MKSMWQILTILCIIAGSLYNTNAQETKTTYLTGDSKALEFGIDQNFQLKSFTGGTLSYKFNLKPLQAIRLGVTISGTSTESTTEYTFTNFNGMPPVLNGDGHRGSLSFSLYGALLNYTSPYQSVYLYWGCGPLASYTYTKSTNTTPTVSPTDSYQTEKQLSAGLLGVIGVEWFASQNLSLHAEYGLSAQYQWADKNSNETNYYLNNGVKTPYTNAQEIKTSGVSISYTAVNFGLSVYF